jgi:hypothetical protein
MIRIIITTKRDSCYEFQNTKRKRLKLFGGLVEKKNKTFENSINTQYVEDVNVKLSLDGGNHLNQGGF